MKVIFETEAVSATDTPVYVRVQSTQNLDYVPVVGDLIDLNGFIEHDYSNLTFRDYDFFSSENFEPLPSMSGYNCHNNFILSQISRGVTPYSVLEDFKKSPFKYGRFQRVNGVLLGIDDDGQYLLFALKPKEH